MLFWIALLMSVISVWIYTECISKSYRYTSITMLILLCTISALRYHLGNDYDTYVMDYYLYENFELDVLLNYVRREPTETLIIYVLNSLNFDYQSLFIVYSIVTFLLVWLILKNVLKSYQLVLIAVIVFAVDYNMMWYSYSIIRQFVAALLCLYSVKYIEANHFMKFTLTVIFASIWHYSAIVFLLVYLIPRKKIGVKLYSLMIAVGMVGFYTNITTAILNVFLEQLPLVGDYAWYLTDWLEDESVNLSLYFYYHLILGFIFLYFLGDDKPIYVNIFCLFNVVYLLCRFCTPLLRMSIYLGIVILVLLPLMYSKLGRYKTIVFVFMIFIPMSLSCLKAIAVEDGRIGNDLSIGNIEYKTNLNHIFKG